MLILLPPSEGKANPESGKKLNLSKLSFSEFLTEVRASQLTKVIDLDFCLPAHQIYTGVLYQALGYESLSATARKRADKSVVIISALMGLVRLNDFIPSYKKKIKISEWKSDVTDALDSLNEKLIIDCRSSTYSGVWFPDPSRTIAIRVFQIKDGKRSVITHMSKKYRGEVARCLLKSSVTPKTVSDVCRLVSQEYKCEFTQNTEDEPAYLDLLIPAVNLKP